MDRTNLCWKLVPSLAVLVVSIPLMTRGQDSGPTMVRSDMPDWSQWRGPTRDGVSEETGMFCYDIRS